MRGKFKIRIAELIFILIIGVLGYYGFSLYRISFPVDINSEKTEKTVNSETLLASFKSDSTYANAELVEKVLEVEGIVKKIAYLNDRYTVILEGQDKFSQVICGMLPSEIEDVIALKEGQEVKIKGICKGYLMDVIMLNCILVTK